MARSDSRVDRSTSVSSMRRTNVPPLPARQQPVEQRRPRVADVELAGRAGRERAPSRAPPGQHGTACAAMASPRPTASTPSLVFPLMLTRSGVDPDAPARWPRASRRCTAGSSAPRAPPSRRRCRPRSPCAATRAVVRASRSRLAASFHRGSVSGKMPADVAEPRRAEHRVGHRVADDVGVGVAERAALGRDPSRRRGRGAARRPAGAGRSRCRRGRCAPDGPDRARRSLRRAADRRAS